MAGAAALKAHVSARHEIADQAKRIERIEKNVDALAERARTDCEKHVNSEVNVLNTRLDAHAEADQRLATDIREIKDTLGRVWSAISRIDANVSALTAKLEK